MLNTEHSLKKLSDAYVSFPFLEGGLEGGFVVEETVEDH